MKFNVMSARKKIIDMASDFVLQLIFKKTTSYQVPLTSYVAIPVFTYDYMDKYYNRENGMWYHDAAFTDLWEECPSHNV